MRRCGEGHRVVGRVRLSVRVGLGSGLVMVGWERGNGDWVCDQDTVKRGVGWGRALIRVGWRTRAGH